MIYIYGLFLNGCCQYVGASADPLSRYTAHTNTGKFRKQRPVLKIFRTCEYSSAARLERQVTLAFKRKGQATLSSNAGGYHSPAKPTVTLLSDKARPYEGELLARKTFIAARYTLCLSKSFVCRSLGVSSADLTAFERGDSVLPFETLGRYADMIRKLSRQLSPAKRQALAAILKPSQP
jgi:predicted GIY-YIG superfamily endonuclease